MLRLLEALADTTVSSEHIGGPCDPPIEFPAITLTSDSSEKGLYLVIGVNDGGDWVAIVETEEDDA